MDEPPRRIAYLVSRFPHFTETFIVREIHEVLGAGLDVDIYALRHFEQDAIQPEARALINRVTWGDRIPRLEVAGAVLGWFVRRPLRSASVCLRALAGNYRSPRFLLRAAVAVPVAMAFARRMQRTGIEHVHAHWATHPALAAWVVGQLTGISYSVTVHAHDLYVERAMLETKLAAAAAVVTISDFNRRMLADLHPSLADLTHVIPCGVEPERFVGADHREASTVVCVGSLQDYKGHEYLLDAARIVVDGGHALELVLVGDGERREELERRVDALELRPVVRFLGHRSTADVSALLARATVVVQPSVVTASGKMEGVPVALMEALASEAAVVATDISGLSELVESERTGLLVPERDADALAAALVRLLDDPELRARLGAAGRDRVMASFDLHRNARTLVGVLTSCVRPADGEDHGSTGGATR